MPGDAGQQGLDRQQPIAGMLPRPLKRLGGQRPQDARQMAADHFDQLELDFQVALVIGQFGGELIRVAAHEERLVLGDHALDAVGIHRLEVGDVADHLPRRPLAGDGGGVQLGGSHPLDGLPQGSGASEVIGNQRCVVHASGPLCGCRG